MTVTVVLSDRALAALAKSPQVGAAMATAAERGAAFVRREAPVRTGEYRDSITVEQATVIVAGQRRAGARLVATAEHAREVEWANGTHVLARSVDAVKNGA